MVVDGLHGVERRDDAGDVALAAIVQHLHADDLAEGRHTRNRIQLFHVFHDVLERIHASADRAELGVPGRECTASDDASHMCAMTELIHQRKFGAFAIRYREIEMLEGKLDIERGGILEVLVHLVDARIDYGPYDVSPLSH